MLYFGEESEVFDNMINEKSQVLGWTKVELYGINRYWKGMRVMDSEHQIIARSHWALVSRVCSYRVTADSCKSVRLRQKDCR